MSSNGDTFRFKPEEEHNKPQIDRSQFDEYSNARRYKDDSQDYDDYQEGGSNKTLVTIAVILAIILVATIAAGIFIIKPKKDIPPKEEISSEIEENEKQEIVVEEEKEEEEEKIISCSLILSPDSVRSKGGKYLITADLFDEDFNKTGTRNLTLDDNTDIRQDGKRISAKALVYLIEEAGGDAVIFDGEVDTSKDVILSLHFQSPVEEEPEENEAVIVEDEEEPPSEESENLESEENTQSSSEVEEKEEPSTENTQPTESIPAPEASSEEKTTTAE